MRSFIAGLLALVVFVIFMTVLLPTVGAGAALIGGGFSAAVVFLLVSGKDL